MQMTQLYKIVMLSISKKQYDQQKFVQFSIAVSHIWFVLYYLTALPTLANGPLLKYTQRSNPPNFFIKKFSPLPSSQSEIALTPPSNIPPPPPIHPHLFINNDRFLMGSSFQEDFCEHIEDTYYSVFPSQQNSASAKEIADVVHRLLKTKAICT